MKASKALSPADGPRSQRTEASPAPAPRRLHWIVHGLFVLGLAGALGVMLRGDAAANWRWTEALVFVLAACSALASLANRVSTQNALTVGLFIFLFSAVVELMATKSGFPFGRRTFTDVLGPKVLGAFAWSMPCIWITSIVTSRGLARLLMRPFRRNRRYGFWLLGLTGVLVALFDLGLEPFASAARGYWTWQTTDRLATWHGAPWAGLLGWLGGPMTILWFATPWFITKRAAPQTIDLSPLVLWAVLQLYFAAGCAVRSVWSGAIAGLLLAVLVPGAALYAVKVDEARRAQE